MSLAIPSAPNAGLFKQGYQNYESEDGAIIRNIEACAAIAQTVQTSLGPYGRNKIVINHLQKMILTSDAASILKELDVVHPAAKLLVMASQQQEAEIGDGTNFVIVLCGELLRKAEELIRMGLKTSEIAIGYERAQTEALRCLEDLVVDKVRDLRSQNELAKAIRTVVAAKQSGSEEILSKLISEAILAVLPKNPMNFNVDNIRVVKIMGGSLEQSRVVRGMVFGREPDGSVKSARSAKVGVFSCPIDISQTETKGTVLLHNAKEMLNFTKGEESQLEGAIKEIYDSGLRVVVAGSTVGELALHYLNRYGILLVKVLSKFELRRLCRVVGASPLARLGAPMPDEMGRVDVVETVEIGGDRVTVFRQEDEQTRTATLVIRAATQNHLDDVERAVDDGVNVIKAITRDARLVAGAGATEMQLAERVARYGERTPELSQYAIKKYAEAFEVIPRTLAESAGLNATEVLATLYASHHASRPTGSAQTQTQGQGQGQSKSSPKPLSSLTSSSSSSSKPEPSTSLSSSASASASSSAPDSTPISTSQSKSTETDSPPEYTMGVDVDNDNKSGTMDVIGAGILDLLVTKQWAIRLATEAARTVLSVDQIIVARQAGGPKPPSGQNPNWDED